MTRPGGAGSDRPPPPASARPDDEARALEEATRGATPLGERQRRGRTPAPGSHERPPAPPVPPVPAGEAAFTVEISGETVAARAPGIDARTLRRLRTGAYPIDAQIDLHGSSREETAPALERFVASAEAAGRRCLLVVHGRGHRSAAGGPVVRPAVWEWLGSARRARASVMAFASAPPRLGGPGATLVLLRKPRSRG